MYPELSNIMWNCLSGPHAKFAAGEGNVRRYATGFSPILGFANPEQPEFAALEKICAPGESFYCDLWTGTPPAGWQIEKEAKMHKMVWGGPMPDTDAAPDAIRLRPEHAPLALELAKLVNPGPFGIRTPELGEYFGYFEGDRLIAMAGERLCAGGMHEVSGISTHPDFQGRGLAKKLTLKLIRRQMLRGKTTFLHVMTHNTGAHAMYDKMGFHVHMETVVRVISRAT